MTSAINKKPDYEGFVLHMEECNKLGIPTGTSDLVRLAEKYNTPVPRRKFNGDRSDWDWDWTGTDMEDVYKPKTE